MSQKQEIEVKSQALKIQFLIVWIGALFLILWLRLAFLQIRQGEALKNFSDSNRFRKQLIVAPRGLILDRYGEILAGNKKITQAVMLAGSFQNLDDSLQQIADIFQVPLDHLKREIKKSEKKQGPFHPLVLKENLSLMEIHKLKQIQWDHAEIQVREADKRIYPLKENGAHWIGYIGPISKKDIQNLKKQKKIFYLLDVVGKSGLEKLYDEKLKGKNGFSIVEVDAKNRLSGKRLSHPFDFLKIDPIKGKDLVLTIDKKLQDFALKAFQRKDSVGPRSGALIVMKTNGEILALLSQPSFDPNKLSSNIDQSLWEKWAGRDSKVFIHKGFQEHYSPGSVFKPFVALAALEERLIDKDTLLNSPGTFKLGRRTYHDHNPKGHGEINVITAIEKSANTFFYQIADQMGIEAIYKYARLFGFGQKTEFLIPGESHGDLPHPSKKDLRLKWQRGDTVNLSIGQGRLLATLLQLTLAYNAIATQGLMVHPFIVKKEPGGEINEPVVLNSLTDQISRDHFATVKEGLRRVIEGAQGTARRHRLAQWSFSGKTGTAQLISLGRNKLYKDCRTLPKKLRHHGWFLSFAPSSSPEIVVAVFTENSCSGTRGSAPVARDIIQYYFKTKESEEK